MSVSPTSPRGPARLLAFAVLAALLAVTPGVALATDKPALVAQADVATSGICGTCTWSIDGDGILVIKPADGVSGTLEKTGGELPGTIAVFPWNYPEFFKSDVEGDGLIKGLRIEGDVKAPADMSAAFHYLDLSSGLDIDSLDTSATTNMQNMFQGVSFPDKADLRVLDTSHVTNMDQMYIGTVGGNSIHDSAITSATTSMRLTWCGTDLTSYSCTSADTSNVTDMTMLFQNSTKLQHLNIAAFNNRKTVTTRAFEAVSNLKDITVGANWDTGKDGAWPTESADRWWSYKEQRWFTNEEITTTRQFIADTYSTTESAAAEGPWRRLAGQNRYGTMASIVQQGFSGSDWAVIATGTNFPDALAASALAGAKGCPVILTDGGTLITEAVSELQRLGVKSAYLMGGTAALSSKVEEQVQALGIATTRIEGATRQETSLAALAMVEFEGWACDTAIVATGEKFADSLSIGPWAYSQNAPVVLANSDGRLSDEAVAAIRAIPGIRRAVIVGGEAAVSADVEAQLSGLKVERLGGATRYETSAAIARWAAGEGQSLWSAAVATGENYPDALAGAALMGTKGGVLLLAAGDGGPAVALLGEQKANVVQTYVLGGDAVVAPSLAETLAAATK